MVRLLFVPIFLLSVAGYAQKKATKPNILLICTDDVGIWNVGAYSHGMMVPTPNIDRIAKEGVLFTDHYAAPTCTPGRAMMITGQLWITILFSDTFPHIYFYHQTSLFLAVQPQYTFDMMKDPANPSISVITVRSFLAKFTNNGYVFVLEPRPIFDLTNDTFDLILSPIIGKALGGRFNLILLAEFPTDETTRLM